MPEETKTTSPPKERSTGKPPRQDDLMWKAILEDLSTDFLRFFFSDAEALFDMERKVEYLDKDFDQLHYTVNWPKER